MEGVDSKVIRGDVSVIVPMERYQELIEKEKNYDECFAVKQNIERGIREGVLKFNEGISWFTESLNTFLQQEGDTRCTERD